MNINIISSKLFYFQNQIKLKHWQTTVFSEHKSLDGLHDIISDLKDEIIEKIIGYSNIRPKNIKIDILKDNINSAQLMDEIIKFADELGKYSTISNMPDIGNVAQTLSGEAAKTKYLLSLT